MKAIIDLVKHGGYAEGDVNLLVILISIIPYALHKALHFTLCKPITFVCSSLELLGSIAEDKLTNNAKYL